MRREQSRRWCGGVVSRSGRKRASPDSSTVERQPRKLEVLVRFLVGACWLFFPYPPNALFLSLDLILSFRRSKILLLLILLLLLLPNFSRSYTRWCRVGLASFDNIIITKRRATRAYYYYQNHTYATTHAHPHILTTTHSAPRDKQTVRLA